MAATYTGPLRGEPPAIELHNTIYAAAGARVDAFEDPAQTAAWIEALVARPGPPSLPLPRPSTPRAELVALRTAVRAVLRAAVDDEAADRRDLETLNAYAGAAPGATRVDRDRSGLLVRTTDHGAATDVEVLVAAIATDAIDLITGPDRDELRRCGAPGCVLLFLRDHPRRAWCSNACGNRARQARHYRRSRS